MGITRVSNSCNSSIAAAATVAVCVIAAELESDVVPIVLQLAKSEMSDDFRSEAAGVSTYSTVTYGRVFVYLYS